MKKLILFLTIFSAFKARSAPGEVSVYPTWPTAAATDQIKSKMTTADLDFLAGLIHGGHLQKDMLCSIKVKTKRETRHFSTGDQWVEMLEVDYMNRGQYDGIPVRAVFAVGSQIKKRIIESNVAGKVEEITLESLDRTNHILTLEHDGRGNIVHLEMLDTLGLYPCQLKY